MRAICDAIDGAQAFVFVLSPDSLSSSICARELEHAVNGHKRLVPVVCREVQEADVPAALRGLNWIRLANEPQQRNSFLPSLFAANPFQCLVGQLLDAVDIDLPWVRLHTRLLRRATEWKLGGRGTDQLLRGEDLESVLAMVADGTREPKLDRLQLSYIEASNNADDSDGPATREALARWSGEVGAVKLMHAGSLPDAQSVIHGEKRFSLFAASEAAIEVGGDFYDFYSLDNNRLLLLVGDVAGKGLAAGFFMQMVKVLVKSAAFRGPFRLEELVRNVDRDVSRENPSMLFVSAFIAILDARTGQLTYCRAGCASPLLVSGEAERSSVDLDGADCVALCVLDGFSYQTETYRLAPGDTLCVFTDGVTDTLCLEGHPFGRDALKSWLLSRPLHEQARETCIGLLRELKAFRADAKAVDDLTALVLHWNHSGETLNAREPRHGPLA